jgi:hypothetical protein
MELIHRYPIISGLQLAFTIWMLVDAYRRPAESFWYFVIIFVPVLGPWAYFFAVKAADFKHWQLPSFLQGRPSLDELRFRCQQAPTLATHLDLAQRLIENGENEEALRHLEEASKIEPGHCRVLFCQAKCHAALGQPETARPLLEELNQRDPRWSYYLGWQYLIEILDECGADHDALETSRQLARLSPTLQHQCILAEHLLTANQTGEAIALLQRALREYDYFAGPGRRLNRKWASRARQLLKEAQAN